MDVLNAVPVAFRSLFSDIPNFRAVVDVCLQLFLAAFCGGVLGWQREQAGKAAGMRTHMLVCLGAAVFILAPKLAGSTHDALSRIMQGITTGIGFVGAGAILKGEGAMSIVGLTTAAGIWMTAAIGVAVGLGLGATALLATVAALFILWLIPSENDRAPSIDAPKPK